MLHFLPDRIEEEWGVGEVRAVLINVLVAIVHLLEDLIKVDPAHVVPPSRVLPIERGK